MQIATIPSIVEIMLYVDNEGHTDPRLNLATEEYLLRQETITEPILFFYIDEPAVMIGRNQNVFEETDPEFLQTKNIHLVRRLSGGGAVYHDLGNLNYSIISSGKKNLHQFREVTKPLVRALNDLGVKAQFQGKSDIYANGKKISGNAQYSSAGRMFSHGTLLFNSDLETLSRALQPRRLKIDSKAVQSVRSQVTNICQFLSNDMTIDEFKQAIMSGVFNMADIPVYKLTADDRQQIQDISAQRYNQWEWNYGRSPKFKIENSGHLSTSQLDVSIEVAKGRVQSISFRGDIVNNLEMSQLETALIGTRYDRQALATKLDSLDLKLFQAKSNKNQLLELIY
jgi:lipoate-protein ligase A